MHLARVDLERSTNDAMVKVCDPLQDQARLKAIDHRTEPSSIHSFEAKHYCLGSVAIVDDHRHFSERFQWLTDMHSFDPWQLHETPRHPR